MIYYLILIPILVLLIFYKIFKEILLFKKLKAEFDFYEAAIEELQRYDV